ncbi:unnamed protein product [Parascedosporium putredinis]|uniref:Uncharacterized protein n=1 Tax=Parascedosporium putredinis TaxID=1442378 RepID=A0A9P1M7F5_9PEZI|nr:unnamed protein product [Parascedosporium putredinis]CAI7990367.1 unnamed protein product [Parascedosporium putredinis]
MTDMAQQKTLAPESPPDYELHNLPARPAQTYQPVTGNVPYSVPAQGERNPGATITLIENTVDLESGHASAQEAQQAAQEEQNSEPEAPKAKKGSLRSRVPRSQVSTGPADEEIWLDGLDYGYGMGRESIPQ